jgi:hypothetical protein
MRIKPVVFMVLLIVFNSSAVLALTMTVGKGSADLDKTVQVPITVDVPNGIAGAAFTITFDSSKITLSDVQSTFFTTFQNQWNALIPVPDPLPPISAEVGGVVYTRPLLTNPVLSGSMVAAARCTPADNSNHVLFNLSFVLKGGAPPGTYAVGIVSSKIGNTDAGYDVAGEFIPMLMGSDLSKNVSDPAAFPVLLDPKTIGGTVVAGSATFNPLPGTDTDKDGMPDIWETAHGLNPLDPGDKNTDLDKDGLSNYEEYLGGSDPSDRNDPSPRILPWLLLILE